MAIALVSGQVAVAEVVGALALTVTLPNNPTVGNLVVVVFNFSSNTNTISSIKDSAGTPNNYTLTSKTPYQNTATFGGAGNTTGIAYLQNVPAGATKSITITTTPSNTALDIWAAEFSGAATTSVFENDATNNSSVAGTTINLPTYTTLNNGDLLIGGCFVSGAVSSAGAPWTEISTLPASGNGAEFTIKAVAGAQAVNWAATSSTWAAIEAAFKASAVAVPTWWECAGTDVRRQGISGRRGAAIMRGDDGIQRPLFNWQNTGWEIIPPQPPHPFQEKRFGAIAPKEDGIEFPLINWKNTGWEITPPQPPHPFQEKRFGAIAPKEDGIETPFVAWKNTGWEITPPQPPHPHPERAAAIMPKEDGTENPFVLWLNTGWEIIPPQPPHPRPERFAAIAPWINIETKFTNFYPSGWEIAPPQPPHPRFEKAGSWITPPVNIEALFVNFYATGWEIQPYQPNHPRSEKWAGLAPVFNIEAVFVPPPATTAFSGWEIQPYQPNHPRPEKWAGIAPIVNVETTFTQFFPYGWEVQPPQPPHPRREKWGSLVAHDDGTEFPLINWLNAGWEIQPPQPPHPRPEKWAAITPKEDGTESPFVQWLNTGWEILPPQPSHPRPERSAAWTSMQLINIDVPLVNFYPAGWAIQPHQPSRPRWEKWGAIAPVLNVEAVFVVTVAAPTFLFDQPVQPPHPRPERFAATIPSGNIDAVFRYWQNSGWEIASFQPQHPRPEQRAASIMRGDDGNEYILLRWFNTGWEIPPHQPAHPRPERAGAIMPMEPGIEAAYIFIQPTVVPWGWDIQSVSPPRRPQWNRIAGALSWGDQGIEGVYFPPLGPLAAKIIALDAAYGDADVTRFYRSGLVSQVGVGEAAAIVIDVGIDLAPLVPLTLVFTKPDGTVFRLATPLVYSGHIPGYTPVGIFKSTTYAIGVLPAAQVDQTGFWACYLQQGVFSSKQVPFYIAPAPGL